MANDFDRSKFIAFDPKARTEEYKRSNHNDFATSSELKQREFTGWRENKLSMEYELWMKGEIVARVTFALVKINPHALEEAMVNYMGL